MQASKAEKAYCELYAINQGSHGCLTRVHKEVANPDDRVKHACDALRQQVEIQKVKNPESSTAMYDLPPEGTYWVDTYAEVPRWLHFPHAQARKEYQSGAYQCPKGREEAYLEPKHDGVYAYPQPMRSVTQQVIAPVREMKALSLLTPFLKAHLARKTYEDNKAKYYEKERKAAEAELKKAEADGDAEAIAKLQAVVQSYMSPTELEAIRQELRKKEAEAAKAEAERLEKKRKEEEAATKRKAEEEAARIQKEAEEAAQAAAEEAEKERIREEAAKRAAELKAKQEEEARILREAALAEAKRKAEEEEAKRKAEEAEEARKRAEIEAQRMILRKKQEEAAQRATEQFDAAEKRMEQLEQQKQELRAKEARLAEMEQRMRKRAEEDRKWALADQKRQEEATMQANHENSLEQGNHVKPTEGAENIKLYLQDETEKHPEPPVEYVEPTEPEPPADDSWFGWVFGSSPPEPEEAPIRLIATDSAKMDALEDPDFASPSSDADRRGYCF